jgi:ubiquinone/menaquinone biosynthesis C-methylase UbiE
MSHADVARAYDDVLVPALFQEWAPRVIATAGLLPGERVLDVACGTGVLARAAADRVGAQGFAAGLDPDAWMLSVAHDRASTIEWWEGRAESIPFADEYFDAVISQFGLMFFTDRRRAIGEMLRVLRPGGRVVLAVWGNLDAIPAYAAVVDLIDRVAGPAAAYPLRAPFVLGDREELAALVSAAGVEDVRITTLCGQANFSGAQAMLEVELGAWLPAMGVQLSAGERCHILDGAERALRPYIKDDGTVAFETSAHIVAGTRQS